MEWFSTPEGMATTAFTALVLIPLGKKLAKRTPTPVDDQALTFLERLLAVLPFTRKR